MKDLKLGRQATIKKWNISLDGMSTTLAELCRHARVDVGFGKDKNGELYLLTKDDIGSSHVINSYRKTM